MPSRSAAPNLSPPELVIRPRTILLLIGLCALAEVGFLVVDYFAIRAGWSANEPFRDLVNLGRQPSLPHWFSTVQLTLISLTLWAIYAVVRKRGRRGRTWILLTACVALTAVFQGARLFNRFFWRAESAVEDRMEATGEISRLGEWILSGLAGQLALALWILPLGLIMAFLLWRGLTSVPDRVLLIQAAISHLGAIALFPFAPPIARLLMLIGGTLLWYLLLTYGAALGGSLRIVGDGRSAAGEERVSGVQRGDRFRIDRTRTLRRLVLVCLTAEIGLVLADYFIAMRARGVPKVYRSMFNLAREDSLPNWCGATQTLLVALTAWLIFVVVRSRPGPRRVAWGWFVVASIFTLLAFDDGARVHETVGAMIESVPLGTAAGPEAAWNALARFPSYTWQAVFVPLLVCFGVFAAIFLLTQMHSRRARVAVFTALALLGTAVGFDFLEGLDSGHPWEPYGWIVDQLDFGRASYQLFRRTPIFVVRHFSKVIEEFIEMAAITMLLASFLGHLLRIGADLRLRLEPAADGRRAPGRIPARR